MTLRLPRVWPPCQFLAAGLVLHAATVGGIFFCCTTLAGMSPEETDSAFAAVPPLALLLGAAAYGGYRVARFHPLLREGYYDWLAMTPWKYPKPLPLGPVHLCWQDGLLIGAAALAAYPWYGAARSLGVIQLFLFVYLFFLLVTRLRTLELFPAYAMWFGLGWVALCRDGGWPFWLAAAATYAAGLIGLRRSFPDLLARVYFARHWLPSQAWNYTYGWPCDQLAPGIRPLSIRPLHGVILALLGGWTFFVAGQLVAGLEQTGTDLVGHLFWLQSLLFVALIALRRLRAYRVGSLLPPISLSGRFGTGRWIIPAYDQVFVAPLLALLAGYLVPSVLYRCGVDWWVAVPVGLGLALMSVLTVGPNRRRWFLAAESRIVPGVFGTRNPNWV